jgi:hypothetical protein
MKALFTYVPLPLKSSTTASACPSLFSAKSKQCRLLTVAMLIMRSHSGCLPIRYPPEGTPASAFLFSYPSSSFRYVSFDTFFWPWGLPKPLADTGHAALFRSTRASEVPSIGTRYPQTPSASSSSTSYEMGGGARNCEKGCVSDGGDESPPLAFSEEGGGLVMGVALGSVCSCLVRPLIGDDGM